MDRIIYSLYIVDPLDLEYEVNSKLMVCPILFHQENNHELMQTDLHVRSEINDARKYWTNTSA